MRCVFIFDKTLFKALKTKQYACDLAVSAWKSGVKSHKEINKSYDKILKEDNSWSNLFNFKSLNIKIFDETITVRGEGLDIQIIIYEDKIVKYDPLFRLPPKKFHGAYYGQKGDLKLNGNGHLWVAGSEIFCKPAAFANEGDLSEVLHMKIADIVYIEKTNTVLGIARSLNIADMLHSSISWFNPVFCL